MLYLGDHSRPVVLRAVDPSVRAALLLQAVGFQHGQVPAVGVEAGHRQVLHEIQLIPAAAAPLWLPICLRRDVVIMSNYFLEAGRPSPGPSPADWFSHFTGYSQWARSSPASHSMERRGKKEAKPAVNCEKLLMFFN